AMIEPVQLDEKLAGGGFGPKIGSYACTSSEMMLQTMCLRMVLQWPPFIATIGDPSDQWPTGTKKMTQGSRSPSRNSSGPPNTGDPGRFAPQSSAVIVFGV